MAKIQINRLTNANIWAGGTDGKQQSLLGRAEEIMLSPVKYKKSEHKAIGMIGTFEIFSGIEKMDCKVKWNSFYQDVFAIFGNPFSSTKIQVRASLEGYDSSGRVAELPVVIYLTAQSSDFPLGNFKQHENVELESNLSVYFAKLEIDGVEVYEIDVTANVMKINGSDLLKNYKLNLGI